jgi:hypothetical protein
MTLKGLHTHPVVVDKDYMGELKILPEAPQTFVTIAPTEKIINLFQCKDRKGAYRYPTGRKRVWPF